MRSLKFASLEITHGFANIKYFNPQRNGSVNIKPTALLTMKKLHKVGYLLYCTHHKLIHHH